MTMPIGFDCDTFEPLTWRIQLPTGKLNDVERVRKALKNSP
jgi:hypothetical protein